MVELHREGSAPAACAAGFFLDRIYPLVRGWVALLVTYHSCALSTLLQNQLICHFDSENSPITCCKRIPLRSCVVIFQCGLPNKAMICMSVIFTPNLKRPNVTLGRKQGFWGALLLGRRCGGKNYMFKIELISLQLQN